MFLPILMMSRDSDIARCKVVWPFLVRYILLLQDILLCSY